MAWWKKLGEGLLRGGAAITTGGMSEVGLGASGLVDDPFGIGGGGGGGSENLRNDTAKLLDFLNKRSAGDDPSLALREQALTGANIRYIQGLDPIYDIAGGLARDQSRLYRDQQLGKNLANEARQGQSQGLDRLRELSQGKNSVVDAQERLARDRLQTGIAGQLASQRGRFNPASQRQAFQALSQGMTGLGAQTAAAKAEEQQSALKALLAAQAMQRGQDMFATVQEGALAQQRAGIAGQRAGLLGSLGQQRLAGEYGITKSQDYARDQAERVAQIIAGLPLQPQEPNWIEKALGTATALAPVAIKAAAGGG